MVLRWRPLALLSLDAEWETVATQLKEKDTEIIAVQHIPVNYDAVRERTIDLKVGMN